MKDQERLEFDHRAAKVSRKLFGAIEELQTSDIPILVEGHRDARALLAIKIPRERIIVTAQKTLQSVLAKLRAENVPAVIDMFDADKEGAGKSRELYKNAGRIKVDHKLKERILTQIKSKKVEDLLSFLDKNAIS